MSQVSEIMELFMVYIGIFLIERYVFLEHGLEGRKQYMFYLISGSIVLLSYLFLGKDTATFFILIAGGLNIALARTEHRLQGFLLIVPIPGIIDGLLVPIFILPVNMLISSERGRLIYTFIIYGLVAVILLVFYIKGKNWRKWFRTEMIHRRLKNWERFLLWSVGVLMLVFSNMAVDNIKGVYVDAYQLAMSMCLMGLTAFVLTVTIIVLIMQGNKRSYYHEQIMDMQFNMIAAMADIVENRDENTGGHIKRTARYVEIIAKTLKKQGKFPDVLTDRYISDMVVAAPLHDIGKIHVSDVILNKPGKLTEEEYQIMKSHAAAGRDLLNHTKQQLGDFEYLNLAVDMAAYHHEWWNGKGYPDGIKEEEIPICARIMAVADVFDALVSKRCYKKEMSLEKAYGIIREEKGTHFDPVVVDAFFAAVNEIEAILKEFDG